MRKINRHAQMRKHKRKMKQKYGYGTLYSGYHENTKLHEDECRERYGDWPNQRNGGYEYWQFPYISGARQFAKESTNGVIRAMYRDLLRTVSEEMLDDIPTLRGADYEKIFDYDWTIW